MSRKEKVAISLEERIGIEGMIKDGLTLRGIANVLGRCPKTISREVSQNGGRSNYEAEKAHKLANAWRALRPPLSQPITPEQEEIAKAGMAKGLPKHAIREAMGIGMKKAVKFFREEYPDYKGIYAKGPPIVEKRVTALEMQIEIILDQIRRLNVRDK
jgi:hypothetical protein